MNIHTKQTTDQVERNEDRRDHRDLGQVRVSVVRLCQVGEAELRKVVGVRAREHFLEVTQIRHHGDDVVLHVAKIDSDVATRSHAVFCVAAFGKSFDDVGFAAEKAHERHDLLAHLTDAR